ncbi:hypothetical protein [Celeribacter sp. ULVN23_4]
MRISSHRPRFRTVISAGPDLLRLSFSTEIAHPVANRPLEPRFDEDFGLPDLQERDTEVIGRLLDVCNEYQQQGEEELSVLVDRIGMRMMELFMHRVENPTSSDISASSQSEKDD